MAGGCGKPATVQADLSRITAALGVVSGVGGSKAGCLGIQRIMHILPKPLPKHWHRPWCPGAVFRNSVTKSRLGLF